MRGSVRLLRHAALAVAVLLLVLSLGLTAGLLWLRSASGDSWLRSEAVDQLNGLMADTGLHLTVDALQGPLPERLQVRGLVLRDAQGPWLSVEEAEVRLDLAALLDPAVLVQSFTLRDARLERLPDLPPSAPSETAFPADLLTWYPSWLRFIRVDALRVERFTLPAELLGLAGEPLVLSAQGMLAVPHAEEIQTRLAVQRVDGVESLTLDAALHTVSPRLRLDVRFEEGQGGLVADLLKASLQESGVPLPTGFGLTLSGDAPLLDWDGDLTLSAQGLARVTGRVGVTLPQTGQEGLTLSQTGTAETSVRLDLSAEAGQDVPERWRALGPLTLQTAARFGADFVELPRTRLTLGASELTADGLRAGLDAAGGFNAAGVLAGLVRVKVVPSPPLAELLPFSSADLELHAAGTLDTPDLRLTAELRELHTPSLSAAQVRTEASLAGSLTQPEVRVRLHSPAFTLSGKPFQKLEAELHTLGERLDRERPLASRVKTELRVGLVTPHGPARLQAEANLQDERFTLSKIQLSGLGLGVDGGVSVPLAAETRANGTLTVRVNDWTALSALLPVAVQADRAEARLALSPDKGQSAALSWTVRGLRVAESGVELTTLSGSVNGSDLFAGPKLNLILEVGDGTLDTLRWKGAKLDFSANAGAQTGSFNASLDSLTYGRVGEAYPITGRLSGVLEDRKTLACILNVSGLGLDPLEGRVNLPLRFADGVPDIPADGRLSGSLHWKGALASVWRLVPLANTRVRGDATVDVTLGGTVGKPRPSGVIRLEKGLFQDLAQAVEVSNIMAEIALQANGSGKAVVTGTDGNKGTFQLSGTVGPAEAGFPLDIRGSIDRLMPLHRRDVRLSLSGSASVTGTAMAPDVVADITVNRGEVRLENLPSGGIETLDVVDASSVMQSAASPSVASPAQGAAPDGVSEAPQIGQLHVTVTVPNRFYVRGHGIESEWQGQLRINGPFNAPAVAGELSSIRGTLSFLNKTFVLKRGSVSFDGGTPPRPMLDIQVSYTQQGFTALITLSGPATRPRLALSSQPALPTDEIVAQILFGKSTSNLARGEALQLAATVASLTVFGQSGGGLLDFTRSAFGLDVLRFGSGRGGRDSMAFSDSAFAAPGSQPINQGDATEDDLTLEVGKYVLDNVYVGLEQGMESDSTGVVVDIEVTPSLSLEARTSGKGSEVGAKWSWDY